MLANVPFLYLENDAIKWINLLKVKDLEFNIFLENNLIGGAGLTKNKNSFYQLGYWLDKEYWGGNGYRTKVCRELINHTVKKLKLKKFSLAV